MRIIGICGSPRKGNTEQMLEWVLESCRSAGADVEMVKLRELDIRPCDGCDACFDTERPCVIQDDMEALTSKLLDSDAMILATPNYFRNVSGLMKDFIDRTNPLCTPPLLKGKVASFVCVGGQKVENSMFVEKIFENYCEDMKLVNAGSVLAQAEDPGEVAKQEDTRLACTDLGNKVMDKLRG